jgi:p-cumate 2,3-dioxygenase subunit alpha
MQDLIIDDREKGIFRVHRSAMTSREVFELERERIFDRCWLYLGHDSELPNPGDYLRRKIAGRPLVFVRGQDGQVRAFFNTCPHRGAAFCRQQEGNARTFQCFYHAWTFNTEGKLVGVPDEGAYASGFDRSELGLTSPARLECYRDFWFVSFNPDVESLYDYLDGAREYLDLVADQSATKMRIVDGCNHYTTHANWKLLVEGSFDGYHATALHQSYYAFLASAGDDLNAKYRADLSRGYDLGHGHATGDQPSRLPRPIAFWHPIFGEDTRAELDDIRTRLEERCGPERARRMTTTVRNLLIYPNLIIIDGMAITVRAVWPVAPDEMEVQAWALAPEEESGDQLARRLDNFYLFLGPAGFGTPDDVEVMEACQEGYQAVKEVAWSDISRGMHSADPRHVDEAQVRAFWREWHAQLQGLPHGNHEEARRVSQEMVLERA